MTDYPVTSEKMIRFWHVHYCCRYTSESMMLPNPYETTCSVKAGRHASKYRSVSFEGILYGIARQQCLTVKVFKKKLRNSDSCRQMKTTSKRDNVKTELQRQLENLPVSNAFISRNTFEKSRQYIRRMDLFVFLKVLRQCKFNTL